MKKRNFIRHKPGGGIAVPLWAAALLLAACSSDSEMNGNGITDGRTTLQVTSGIQTRAYDDVWEPGDAVGIFSLHKSGESTTVEDVNRKYTTTSEATKGTFEPADAGQTVYFPTNGDTRDFIAYYPWQKTLGTDGKTYTVDVTDQKVQNRIDLLGSDKVEGRDKDNPQVAFTFTHKLVKIALKIQPGHGLDKAALAGTKVTLTGQRTGAVYDVVAGGEVSIPQEGEEVEVELLTAADGTISEAIVLPASDTEGMKLIFDVPDVGTFDWKVKDAPKSQAFEAGKKYIYTITINKVSIKVESTVTDWLPGNGEGETGSAE